MPKRLFLITSIAAVILWGFFGCKSKLDWEDFKGGAQIILEVDSKGNPSVDTGNTLKIMEIIGKRMEEFGIKKRIIKMQSERRIIIQLPQVADPRRAGELFGKAGVLEFKLVDEEHSIDEAMREKVPEGSEILYQRIINRTTGEVTPKPLLLKKEALLTGADLKEVKVNIDSRYNEPYVSLEFDAAGSRLFERITSENVNKRLAIILDNNIYTAPVVREKIEGGHAQITGSFTLEEAKDLAIVLRSGALPATVKVIESKRLTKDIWLGGGK